MPERPEDDEVEIDLSEADPTFTREQDYAQHPVDWDALDLEEPIDPIEPLPEFKTSWGEVDSAALLKGSLVEPAPCLLHRSDGEAILYPGKVHSIAGEPESGKGWFALTAVLDAMRDERHTVYLDFEDTPSGVLGRLRALGVPDGLIVEKFHYVRPTAPLRWTTTSEHGKVQSNETWQELLAVIDRAYRAQGGLALIVFDGITEALAMQGIESKDNDQVADWFGKVPRKLAHASRASVLLVDHVVKSNDDRGRYAIGAQAKLAAVDGCQFTVEMKMAFAYGRSGLARIKVSKDRPGQVRRLSTTTAHLSPIADMVITADPNVEGHLSISLVPPDIHVDDAGVVKPTGVQAAIVAYLRRVKGGRGRQAILDAVKGRAQVKRQAFNDMLDNGWLVEYQEGRKTVFKLGTPQDEIDARPEDQS